MTQDYRTFHLQRFARGPATAGDKNRSVTNHEYSNGRRTSYHPNDEQMDAIRERMRFIAKHKRLMFGDG
jgi:hypothetical protein